ncbi:MAG: hypothetical protein PF508_12960, partial [Spirochaeta sp.]|nr:hypothetical protein [Spirochaeta sp.]
MLEVYRKSPRVASGSHKKLHVLLRRQPLQDIMAPMQRARPAITISLFVILGILSLSLRPLGNETDGALRNYNAEAESGAPAFPI